MAASGGEGVTAESVLERDELGELPVLEGDGHWLQRLRDADDGDVLVGRQVPDVGRDRGGGLDVVDERLDLLLGELALEGDHRRGRRWGWRRAASAPSRRSRRRSGPPGRRQRRRGRRWCCSRTRGGRRWDR